MNLIEIENKKQDLIAEADNLSKGMSQDLESLKSKLKDMGIRALIISASVVTFIYLWNVLFSSKKKKKIVLANHPIENKDYQLLDQKSINANYWYAIIKEQLMLFLLTILRSKLSYYVEEVNKANIIDKVFSFFSNKVQSKAKEVPLNQELL